MTEYRAEWPIEDPTMTFSELRREAHNDLADMLEAVNLVASSGVTFTLVARMHVQPEISPIGDLRPWESRYERASP